MKAFGVPNILSNILDSIYDLWLDLKIKG